MRDASKATISGLIGPDKVGGATEWRSRYDSKTKTNYNVFRNEGGF